MGENTMTATKLEGFLLIATLIISVCAVTLFAFAGVYPRFNQETKQITICKISQGTVLDQDGNIYGVLNSDIAIRLDPGDVVTVKTGRDQLGYGRAYITDIISEIPNHCNQTSAKCTGC